MIGWILGLFNPLKRILDSIDNRVDNDTRRVEITADVQKSFYMAQVQIATTSGRYLMNFIGFTFALHAFAVVMYSIFFCSRCMAPQTWVVAALPAPFDQWEGAIIMSFFVQFTAQQFMRRPK